jgi:hypothetical protein
MDIETALVKANNISIYQSDIDMIAEDYINTLPDETMIYKSAVFSGLLDNIYKRLLKNVITRDNGLYNRSLDYKVLDNIFRNIYLPLCTRYGIVPTIQQFSTVLCNISNSALSEIRKGYHRTTGAKVNPNDSAIVQKWYELSESGLYSRAIQENSIGSIFALKAVHGMSDTQTIRIESNEIDSHETAAEIMARHDSAMIPQKPDLSTE